MNKKEMQEELVTKHGYSQEDVEGKTNAVLEKMLKEAREKEEAEAQNDKEPEGSVEDTKEPEQGAEGDGETDEVEGEEGEEVAELRKRNIVLTSVKEHIYVVRKRGAKVIVENKGHGDVYVGGAEDPIIGKLEQLILRGEKKVLEGVDSVRVISSSSPEVEITEVK